MTKIKLQKRDAILKAALTLFSERGFHNTPTSLIAKQAGVATGTLFHHFKNKEELINALYLELKMSLVEALKNEVEKSDSLKETLKNTWINGVKWGIMHPKEMQFILQYANSPFISHLTREQAMGQYEFIAEIYEKAMQEGIIKSTYADFVPDYFEGIFNLAVTHFRKHPEKISEENLEMAFDICWDGIAVT
jgi:AcrR family transcriptional regulator